MKKLSIVAVLMLVSIIIAQFFAAMVAANVAIDNDIVIKNNQYLVLNGAGMRTKAFIDMYKGALYLERVNTNAQQIIDADRPMAITLYITSGLIGQKTMTDAAMEGFQKATKGNIQPIEVEIAIFLSVFNNIKKGDIYTFLYTPEEGTEVFVGEDIMATIPGLEFKKALFGIWLGDDPVQESLKSKMLGE
jgi:hypothetical protein